MPVLTSQLDYKPIVSDLALADVDEDGDSDIIGLVKLDLWNAYAFVWTNSGSGTFTVGWNHKVGANGPLSVAVADFNLDGHVDFVAKFEGIATIVYQGNGSGTFQNVFEFFGEASDSGAVTIHDLDADTYPDIISVEGAYENSEIHVFRNNKNGTFGVPSSSGHVATQKLKPPLANSTQAAAADINGDGLIDLVANDSLHDQLLLFAGTGPLQWSSTPTTLPTGESPVGAVASDVDLDGDADILTPNYDDGTIALFEDTGTTLAAPTFFGSGYSPQGLRVADLNGDCYPDVYALSAQNSYISVSMNDGAGKYPVASRNYSVGAHVISAAAGDVDGDQDLDLVAGNMRTWAVYDPTEFDTFLSLTRNLGDGRFWAPRALDAVPDAQALAIGDFNGDAKKDFAFGNAALVSTPLPDLFTFVQPGGLPVNYLGDVGGVGAPDLNGDGLSDLIQNVESGVIRAFVSNGNNTFTQTWSIKPPSNSLALDVGNLDGDAFVDFVNVESWAFNLVFRGAPASTFQAPLTINQTPGSDSAGWPTLADLDEDGLDDILIPDWKAATSGLRVAKNLGNGTAYSFEYYSVPGGARVADTADYDEDGKLDVALAVCGQSSGWVAILFGNGDGTLDAPTLYPAGKCPYWLDSGDLDDDGDIDLIVSGKGIPLYEVTFLPNAGNGSFPAPQTLISAWHPGQVVVTNLDADADLDFAVAHSAAYTVTLFENQPLTTDPGASNAQVCDLCPSDPQKAAPGLCGCGVSDVDSDGDDLEDCHDDCPVDPNKTKSGICGCAVSDADSDSDGTADCNDQCPADGTKVTPGICGCGVPDTDGDGDSVADCADGCPSDPTKTDPGTCGCGISEADGDGDGTKDCEDDCASDATKTAPGVCGCGMPDADSDGDQTLDCNDACPADPTKTDPGPCPCGVAEVDTDGDGVSDCTDGCLEDPAKISPAACGCGVPDLDGDSDGTPDCSDDCPSDPAKTEPGACGCSIPDVDVDDDGTMDCTPSSCSPDSGVSCDAGTQDSGGADADAGTADAALAPPAALSEEESGCSCSAPGSSRRTPLLAAFCAVALVFARQRRRHPRPIVRY